MRALLVMALAVPLASAKSEDVLIDDFTSGELFLPLQEGVRFDSFSQTAEMGPIVRGQREWSQVWSAIREEGQSATIAIDIADGVLRVDTPGDPFTYFRLSYSLFGGVEQFQPLPFDAIAAGLDRVRFRFADDSARIYHTVSLTSEVAGVTNSEGRSLGGRFISVPGGVLEIPFEDFFGDAAFFTALTEISLSSTRFQGEFALDSIELAGPPLAGDLNRDGVIDGSDLAYLQAAFKGVRDNDQPIAFPTTIYHTADLNGDGQINTADYTAWRDVFDATPLDNASASVPEPGAFALAIIAAGMTRRRVWVDERS